MNQTGNRVQRIEQKMRANSGLKRIQRGSSFGRNLLAPAPLKNQKPEKHKRQQECQQTVSNNKSSAVICSIQFREQTNNDQAATDRNGRWNEDHGQRLPESIVGAIELADGT